jgi:soluble lytic murein transglycosylase-like protein
MNQTESEPSIRRRTLMFLFVATLGLLLFVQQQQIGRLRDRVRVQEDLLAETGRLASRATAHLELIRRFGIPYDYLEVLADAATQHGLDLTFLVGLMQVESHFNPNARSEREAYGLMQVRFPTAQGLDPSLLSYWQLFEPDRNIRLGVAYFRSLLDRYNGDYRMAALAYNRGPTRLDSELLADGDLTDLYYQKIRAAGIVN